MASGLMTFLLAVPAIQSAHFAMEVQPMIVPDAPMEITWLMEEIPAKTLKLFSNVLVLSMGMKIQNIQFVRLVIQHVLYVLTQLSPRAKSVMMDGGWLIQSVMNVKRLVILVLESQLKNA